MATVAFESPYRFLGSTSEFEPERLRLTEKVRRMADLPTGWSHGEGIPVSEAAIGMAEEFISLVVSMELHADVFPNLDGGCAIAFYKYDDRVEVSIDSDGKSLGLRYERGKGFKFEDIITPNDNVASNEITQLLLQLQLLGRPLWKSYDSSTSVNSTVPANDSATSFTGTQQTPLIDRPLQTEEGGSQSSKPLAPVLVKG